MEEAIRLVEAVGGESVVLTLGPAEAVEQLRDAMALGVDRAIHLETDGGEWDPQATAAAIVEVARADEAEHGPFDLIFFGNEAADSGGYQVGLRVAHALGRPVATGLKGVSVADGSVRCEQEVAGGRDVYRLALPAVVTVKEGLNFPRFPSVPGRLRAQRKPVAASTPARPEPRLAKERLVVPEGERKQAEILGHGPRGRAARRRGAAADRRPLVSVLVYLEHADGVVDDSSLQALTFARSLAGAAPRPLSALVSKSQALSAALAEHSVGTCTSRRRRCSPRTRRARSRRRSPSSPSGSVPLRSSGREPSGGTRCSRTSPRSPTSRSPRTASPSPFRRVRPTSRASAGAGAFSRRRGSPARRPCSPSSHTRSWSRRHGRPAPAVETFRPRSPRRRGAPGGRAGGRGGWRSLARGCEGRRLGRTRNRLDGGLRGRRGARRAPRGRRGLLARGDDGGLAATHRPGRADGDEDRPGSTSPAASRRDPDIAGCKGAKRSS